MNFKVKKAYYRLFSVFLSLVMIVISVPLMSINANATEEDFSGLWLFNNVKYNNKYIHINNVDNPGENEIIELHTYNPYWALRWYIINVGNGYYKIESILTGLVLTAPTGYNNDIVRQTTYTGANTQLWKFIKQLDGTYKISPKSNHNCYLVPGAVSNAADQDLEISFAQSDGGDKWYLLTNKDFLLMYIGDYVGDPLMPPLINSVKNSLETNANMVGDAYTSLNKDRLIAHLSNTSIFSCITHGLQVGIQTSNGLLTTVDIDSLHASALSNLKFAYLGACYTGQGKTGAINLVNSIYNRGADAVLGFTVNVLVDETNQWSKDFMEFLSEGYSISTAMYFADIEVKRVFSNRYNNITVLTNNRYFVGSEQMVPCG